MDMMFEMPLGIPNVLAYRKNQALWDLYLTNGGIRLLEKRARALKFTAMPSNPQEKMFVKGLPRTKKEIYRHSTVLSQRGFRCNLHEIAELPEEKNMMIEYIMMRSFASKNNIELDESPITNDEIKAISEELPWFDMMHKVVVHRKYKHINSLPFSRWLKVALELSEQEGTDHVSIIEAFFAISSWYNSPIPLMALVEKNPDFKELLTGMISGQEDLEPLPIYNIKLYSVDMHLKSKIMDIQLAVIDWKKEIGAIELSDINDGLTRVQAIGEEAKRLSLGMKGMNETIISRSIGILLGHVSDMNDIMQQDIVGWPCITESHLSDAKNKWGAIGKSCISLDEQGNVINNLSGKINATYEDMKAGKIILSKLDKINNEASNAIKSSISPFSNIEKLNNLSKQHDIHQDQLKELLQKVKSEMMPGDELTAYIGRQEKDDKTSTTSLIEEKEAELKALKELIDIERARIVDLENENKLLKEDGHLKQTKILAISEHTSKLREGLYGENGRILTEQDIEALNRVIKHTDQATPVDVLTVISILHSNKIVITSSAWKSAMEASSFVNTERLFALLTTLVTDYLDAINSGQPDSVARRLFGKAYSAKESETVMSNAELRRHRLFIVGEQEITMEQHLIIGVAQNIKETMRVHFSVIDGVIAIGHCGAHLPLPNAS